MDIDIDVSKAEGEIVGKLVGLFVGRFVGLFVGTFVGRGVGVLIGADVVGAFDGVDEGARVGQSLEIGPLVWVYQIHTSNK